MNNNHPNKNQSNQSLLNKIEHELSATLLDYLNVNLFVIDKQRFYIYKNSALTSIVGEIDQADDDNGWLSCVNVMETGNPQRIEEEHDGKWYLSVKKPLFDDSNTNIIGVIGISIDITDRKKAEEYRLKHEASEKVVKFTNLVAGSIAHELKNPLAGIKINIENLLNINFEKISPKMLGEMLKPMGEAIISTINSTNHVISDMLLKVRTFATGKVPQTSFSEISIASDIEALLETFPFSDGQQDLVNVVYNKNRFKYLGDKGLTSHVLGNLLKNALHAISEADKGEITIELKSDNDNNILLFRDTASGIPADFVDKIFDQFETKKTANGGTGLGLAFCKMVMDYYKGSITCHSKEGEYTEFVLTFPKLQPIKNV